MIMHDIVERDKVKALALQHKVKSGSQAACLRSTVNLNTVSIA